MSDQPITPLLWVEKWTPLSTIFGFEHRGGILEQHLQALTESQALKTQICMPTLVRLQSEIGYTIIAQPRGGQRP